MINTYGVISGVLALQQETLKNTESNLIPVERLDPISTWSGRGGGGEEQNGLSPCFSSITVQPIFTKFYEFYYDHIGYQEYRVEA